MLLAGMLAAGALTVTGTAPALATPAPTCGSGGSPAVVALADPSFYVDTSAGLDATYAGYTVRAGATGETGLWLTIGGFSGGSVALAPGQPGSVALPNIAAGSSATSYLLLKAAAATTTPQSHTVSIYRGHPSGGNLVCQRAYSYSGVYEAIKALANKVTSVTANAPSGQAHIGDIMDVTVIGNTGTLGAGPAADPGVLSYAPDALSGFPAGAWRLEKTVLTISPDGVAPPVTFTDRLYLAGASGPNRPYTGHYSFRAIGPADATSGVQPVQYIASGTQVKHTDISGGVLGSLPAISREANVQLAKSASAAVLPAAGGTVTYTVTAANFGTGGATLDRIVDTLPSGATYHAGTTKLAGRTIDDPAVAGRQLTWSGPVAVPAGGDLQLTYDAGLPGTSGIKTNSAIAYYGTAELDSSRDVTVSNPATATVTVLDAAGTAHAVNDTASTNANTSISVNVLANDTSTGAFPLSISAAGSPAHGSAVVRAGAVVYTPASGFAGTDGFTYTLSDGYSTATGSVSVAVNPGARNDAYVTPKSTTLNGSTVLANDACTGCTVSLVSGPTVVSGPAAGTLTLNANGTFSYAAPNQAQALTFVYRATASGGASATATATIYVNAAGPDYATTASATAVTIPVTANDTCPGGGNCNISSGTTSPTHGAVSYSGVNIVYTPAAGFWGLDTFTYNLNGGAGATVTVLVAPAAATMQTTFGTAVASDVDTLAFTGATAINCSGCVYSVATSPSHGTVSLASTTGDLGYTPDATFAGTDSFTYAVNDAASGLSISSSVTVTVGPDAVNDTVVTAVRHDTSVNVLANDSCPGTCTVAIVAGTGPSTGAVSVNPDKTLTFSSAPAHDIGTTSFQYRITSSLAAGINDTATVTVMVNGAADDTATTTPGQAAVIDVAANDPCTDCTISGLGAPAAGTATLNQAGTVTYTPPAGFSGTTSFTYQVSKNGHATSATVTVTVLPAAVDDNVATAAGSPVTLDPRGNDLCVACVVTSAAAPDGGGTAVVAPDGRAITYTPGVPAGHVEHFAYTVTDTEGHTATATVTVAVDAPPTASADSATTDAGIPVVTDVLANDTCAGCTPDVASDPTHGTVVFRADGKAQYRPAAGFSGVDSFRYLVTDPVTGLAATATVTVAVLPKAADDMVATAEGVALTIDIQANDSCTSCAVTIPTGPSHGGATVNPDGTLHYTPGLAFQGSDQLSYRLTDPATGTAVTAIVFVTVSNATADSATTTVTTSVDIDVLANDACASCSIVAVGYPAHGTAAVVAGRIRYTPASGFWGLDHFTYAAGANGTSSPATVTVMVAPPLRHVTGDTNATVTGSLLGDAPCATCVFTVVAAPAGGDITLNADGTWSYTPVAGTNPDDTITYRVTDPVSGTTVTGTLTISVRPSQVTVTVAVVNDNGGTRAVADFPVTLNGASVTSGATNTLPSGVSYTVGMAAVAGYAATSVDCADIDTLATSGHPFTLAPGQRVACTVTEDDVAAGAHVSLAATATGPVDANSSGRTDAGDTVGYGYQVTNTGTTTATGLQVGDGHVSTSAIGCGSTASNTVASLASGVSVTCAASYTITQADIDAGSISTVASVTGDPVGGAAVTATDTTAVTLPRANGVAVTTTETGRDDTDANGHDSAGDVIHYHVAGTNTGTTTLTGAATGNSITTDATACATLAPGLTCIADTSYVVTQADVDAGTLDIVGTATGHGPDAAAVVAHATATSTLAAPAPSLSIAQSLVAETDTDHSGTRNAGDVLTYDITVASSGGRTAHTVVVVDDLTGDSSNCGSLAPAITCTLRTIHTVTAAEGLADAVVNTAHATASDAATMSTSLSVAIVHRNGLSITALLDQLDTTTVGPVGRVDAGDHAHYRYTITNTGESSLHEITITGPLAAAAICPSGNATVADLAAGASVPCTADHVFDQAEVDAGALDAGAHAAGTTAGGAAAQLEASVALTTGLPAQPGLALAETVAPGATCQAAGPQAQVERGSDVTWCFAVTNTGNVTMTNVGLTDPALGFVDGGPQPAPFDTPTALTPGQTATAHVTTSAAGDVTDTARAQGRHSGATALSPDATAAVTTTTVTTTTPTTTTPDGHEVAGIIWFDSNGNGGRDHGEPALPGVHVSLERDSSTIAARLRMVAASSASGSATTVTGPDGRYSFAGITPGRYTIFASVGGSGLPATWDTDGHADWQVGVSIQGNDATADFATTPPGAINGRVTDLATAAGIAGAQVDCAWAGIDGVAGTADDVVFTTVAGADGSYGQTGIPPGDFACRATDPLTGAHKLFAAAVEAGQATRADAELGQPVSLPPVTEAPAPVFAGALVHTGLDPRRRAAGGAALVLLGLALTMAARRRDRATPRGRPRSGPAAGGR